MAYIYDLTDTWNAGGTTFNAIKMNVTDSASASASKLVTLQTNGTERFSVTKGGQGYFSGNVGIGAATPSYPLTTDYNANAAFTNSGSDFAQMWQNSGTNALGVALADDLTARFVTNNGYSIAFNSASSEFMRITSAGNVGIGTSSPSYPLEVRQDGATTLNWIGSLNTTATGGYGSGFLARAGSGFSYFYMRGDGLAYVENATANPLCFATNGVERMRLDASGNVMVGTTSANSKFLVTYSNPTAVPAAGAGGHCAAFGTVGYGLAAGAITNGNAYLQATRWDTLATNYDLLLQPNGGNVGIGTSSPSTSLDVATAGNRSGGNIYIGSKANNFTKYTALVSTQYAYDAEPEGFAMIATQSSSTSENSVRIGGYIGELNAATDVIFYTAANTTTRAGTERMRLDSSGNLLVGTTANPYSTRVRAVSAGADTFQAVQPSAGGYNFSSDAYVNGGAYYHMWFGESGTQRGSITSNGSTVSYNTSSDYRLKDIDGPIANSGAYIDALKPVQGSWKASGSRFIGLLAHEAQEVSETQIATGEKDGEEMQAMDYSAPEIIANLIAEIQSLRARVAQLEGN